MGVTPVRVGLVGYGAGGRWFHAPFISAAEGITLAGVAARSQARAAEARADLPEVPVFRSLAEMLEAGVDAVTITTPPATHEELAEEAIAAGVHVVVDKPFVPTAARARRLLDAASAADVILCVYQNRRWDADFRTLTRLIDEDRLGRPSRVLSRMDQDNLASLGPGPGYGLLLDLGTHMIDQMMSLLGPVTTVCCRLGWIDLPGGRTECSFALDLEHEGGSTSYVESTKAHHVNGRQLRAYGEKGCFSLTSSDIQERLVKSGRRPADDLEHGGTNRPNFGGRFTRARVKSACRPSRGDGTTTTASSRQPFEAGLRRRFQRRRPFTSLRSSKPHRAARTRDDEWPYSLLKRQPGVVGERGSRQATRQA